MDVSKGLDCSAVSAELCREQLQCHVQSDLVTSDLLMSALSIASLAACMCRHEHDVWHPENIAD